MPTSTRLTPLGPPSAAAPPPRAPQSARVAAQMFVSASVADGRGRNQNSCGADARAGASGTRPSARLERVRIEHLHLVIRWTSVFVICQLVLVKLRRTTHHITRAHTHTRRPGNSANTALLVHAPVTPTGGTASGRTAGDTGRTDTCGGSTSVSEFPGRKCGVAFRVPGFGAAHFHRFTPGLALAQVSPKLAGVLLYSSKPCGGKNAQGGAERGG